MSIPSKHSFLFRPFAGSQRSNQAGFTLIEIIMAITISAIVMSAIGASFYQSHQATQIVRQQNEVYQMARTCMDRMLKDLSCTYIPSYFAQGCTPEQIARYRFIGKHDNFGVTQKDSIYFTTTTDIGMEKFDSRPLREVVCEVDYFLKEMEDNQNLYRLIRREDMYPHQDISTAGLELEIAENVTELKISYLDDSDTEKEDWDISTALELPSRVKIQLTLKQGEEEYTFTGVASLALSSLKIKIAEDSGT